MVSSGYARASASDANARSTASLPSPSTSTQIGCGGIAQPFSHCSTLNFLTKATKQMLGIQLSPNQGTDQPKKLPSNKPDGSAKIVTKKSKTAGGRIAIEKQL
jgi:hypothetical protein